MREKTTHKETLFLSSAFIVSTTLAISFVVQLILHYLDIYSQDLNLLLGLLVLAGVYVFSKKVFAKLYRKNQYLILFSNLLCITIGALLLFGAVK